MKNRLIYLIVPAVVSLGASYSVMAAGMYHDSCGGTTTITVENMGSVNEAALQQHIDITKERLSNNDTRGFFNTPREAQRHLARMQYDMKQLHDKLVENGCAGAVHGASLETRVSALEGKQGK